MAPLFGQTVNLGMVFRFLLDRKSVKVGDERSKYCGVKNVIPSSLIRINTQTAVKIIIENHT